MIKNLNLFVLSLIILFLACTTEIREKKIAVSEIKKLETELVSDSTALINTTAANKLIEHYKIYVNKYPEDTTAGNYLFKAGELAMNLNQSMKAIVLLKQFERDFSDHSKMPYCIFFQAFIFENQMNNLEKAEQYYQQFIDDYPGHELVDDAETSIKNLGKSLEEIILEFEKNNKTGNS